MNDFLPKLSQARKEATITSHWPVPQFSDHVQSDDLKSVVTGETVTDVFIGKPPASFSLRLHIVFFFSVCWSSGEFDRKRKDKNLAKMFC